MYLLAFRTKKGIKTKKNHYTDNNIQSQTHSKKNKMLHKPAIEKLKFESFKGQI